MPKLKRTLFISDLHMDQHSPVIVAQFLDLMSKLDSSVDALYILGDLFEGWIGDDEKNAFRTTIIDALKQASEKGIALYFIHGNRDFLIGKRFSKATGCTLLHEETKVMIYETPVLLMHGDTLCTEDRAYLRSRKIIRNKFLLSIFLRFPAKYRNQFGEFLRQKSKKHTSKSPSTIMDVTQDAVIKVMNKHEVNYLIHGHTHRCAVHEFQVNHELKTRMVLDAWHQKGSALIWDSAGNKKFVSVCDMVF